jgi:hypothetical protein
MIFLFFQLIDLLTAFVLVTAQHGLVSSAVLFYHGSYLIAKGAWFHRDWMSWIDALIGVYLLLMIFGVRGVLSYVAAAWFLYKFSLYWIHQT